MIPGCDGWGEESEAGKEIKEVQAFSQWPLGKGDVSRKSCAIRRNPGEYQGKSIVAKGAAGAEATRQDTVW